MNSLVVATTVFGPPATATRTTLGPSVYEITLALTNSGRESGPNLLTVVGWLMSVMSRTMAQLLPRNVTSARLWLEGADAAGRASHGSGGGFVALGVGRGVARGVGTLVGAGLRSTVATVVELGVTFAVGVT